MKSELVLYTEKIKTAPKIECTLDLEMPSLFHFFFSLLKKKIKQTQTLLYPCGLVGLVQHLSSILDWFSNIRISISCVLFPDLISYITEVCIRKYPHPQIFSLWKLFPGLFTNELWYQYLQILCSRVFWEYLPTHYMLFPFKVYCLRVLVTSHPSPKSFLAGTMGWAPPAPAGPFLQLFPVHPISLADRSHARLSGEAEFFAVFYFRQWWQLRYTERVSTPPIYIT